MQRQDYSSSDFSAALARQRAAGGAMSAAHTALKAQARRTALAVIKDRARRYAVAQCSLDAIVEGLSMLNPRGMVTALKNIRLRPTRFSGFGGEVPAINLRAAMLYARYLRAKAAQLAKRGRAAA